MRLWHKDLIPYLPNKQLLGQWRECCAIASNIYHKGSPNHFIVNKIMNYPLSHFDIYTTLVFREMENRGYKPDYTKFSKYIDSATEVVSVNDLFSGWHNDKYLKQCFYNLQEKYDCGGISKHDWKPIENYYSIVNSL